MSNEVLAGFFRWEYNSYIHDLLSASLRSARSGEGPVIKEVNANRYDVIMDFERDEVLIQDIITPSSEGSVRVRIDEFFGMMDEAKGSS
ncbi:MAG: hypothetical protein AAGD01_11395 [Acidobacteriota bacterium]